MWCGIGPPASRRLPLTVDLRFCTSPFPSAGMEYRGHSRRCQRIICPLSPANHAFPPPTPPPVPAPPLPPNDTQFEEFEPIGAQISTQLAIPIGKENFTFA